MNIDFSKKRILVIGDVMLDQYAYYISSGQSAEAPVPILKENDNIVNRLGGAANVAANLKSLGVNTTLSGVIGHDEEATNFFTLLTSTGIKHHIFVDNNRPTTRKRRILASSKAHPPYQITRLDNESTDPIPQELEQKVIKRLTPEIQGTDAMIFSDYSKGFLTENLIQRLKQAALTLNLPVLVDTKPSKIRYYKGSTLFKPNIKEVEEITGIKYISYEDTQKLKRIGVSLFGELAPTYILFTLGEDGMVVYSSPEVFDYIPSRKIENADVSGAGDTVIASLAASLAAGYSILESAKIANYAASIVVGKRGTATCSLEELTAILKNE